MAIGIGVFLTTCVVAVICYTIAGWKLSDAVYMVVITIFGVGYGEVQPVETTALRVLTMSVIVVGYGAVIYTVGGFMQMLIDGELKNALGARRMTKEIDKLERHTIICGVGRMGSILARELKAADKPFVIVDVDEKRLLAAEELGYLTVHGDAAEERFLEAAGIQRASILATVLPADAANVFVTITARELNPNLLIIARGENPKTEKKLLGCGANRVVLPMAIGAHKLAQLIIRPSAEHMLEQLTHEGGVQDELSRIGLRFNELTVVEGSPLVDRTLNDIDLRGNQGFLIVSVRRLDGAMVMNPHSTTRLHAGDTVIVLGREDDIPQLEAKFFTSQNSNKYRGTTRG
ncbi:MAG: potassium channel protein [Pirellulales bacterium]